MTFAYPSRPDIEVLKDFELKINGGEFVAFCGESGCGKSTANKLILRSYDVLKGLVKIDGIDIKKLNLHKLHRQMGLVAQEP